MRYFVIIFIFLFSCGKKHNPKREIPRMDTIQITTTDPTGQSDVDTSLIILESVDNQVISDKVYKIVCDTTISYYLNTENGGINLKEEITCDTIFE